MIRNMVDIGTFHNLHLPGTYKAFDKTGRPNI
jgi:hypothetical protein